MQKEISVSAVYSRCTGEWIRNSLVLRGMSRCLPFCMSTTNLFISEACLVIGDMFSLCKVSSVEDNVS
jgi:hypothetical protein